MAGILTPVESAQDFERLKKILGAYESYLHGHHPKASLKNELSTLPGPYAPPAGRLFLIISEGRVAGCVAFRPLEEVICEMRRLFVLPAFRRRGLGRRAGQALMQEARGVGYEKMRLLTLPFMREADALYRSIGFRTIPPYRRTTAADAIFMEASLV